MPASHPRSVRRAQRARPRCVATRTAARTAALAVTLLAACAPGGRPRRGELEAEFLAVAGDSTYWVTSGPEGVRARSAPLFLTRWDGRLADVYVVDDVVRFDEPDAGGAQFTTVRVYRRDLLRGDSALVAGDSAVPRLAARWAAAHPRARPLDDEADAEDGPAFVAEHDVGLVAVHGPYLTVDVRTTVDDDALGAHHDELRRRVLDLRTGRPASLATLFGPDAARAVATAGTRAFAVALANARSALDTLGAPGAPAADDDSAADSASGRARAALPSLRFDPANFGLTTTANGAPAVQFVARGRDADGDVTLALPAVPVDGGDPAWWAADVRPLLPGGPDVARLLARARHGIAPESGDTPDPPEQVVRLDRPPADPALRRALRRAFDESARGDAVVTSVARRSR